MFSIQAASSTPVCQFEQANRCMFNVCFIVM